jgi:thiol-disulfide isomerase/thioredoxin/protocatechuate 3,4-dioxygenase beta subunit
VISFLACTLLLAAGSSTVQGRVLGSDGTPVADARVVLGEFGHATVFYNSAAQNYVATPGIPDPEGKSFAAELSTDAKGWFAARGLAAGEYTLLASHAILGVGLSTVRVAEGQAAEIEIRLTRMAYVDARISGLVFDPQRHTVELVPERNGTNVEFHPQIEPVPGTWSFKSARLPMEGWRIVGSEVVFRQDYRATLFSFPVRITKEGAQTFAFDASKGIELQGTVVDEGGRPLSGVSVVARSLESRAEIGAVTDGQGSYRIRGLSPGKHVLEAMRWRLRDAPGCGNGPLDVSASREISLPLADPALARFEIDRLLPVPKVGDPAPAFEARTIEGLPVSLGALRGKVVLLDFWATWCGSCRVEMPKLLESYAKHGGGGRFEIVGVSLDTDPDRVPRFLASRRLAWPQTALGPEPKNPIAALFNVHSTPSTVLVDAQGRIAALNLLGEPLEKKIEELLAGG